MSLLQVLLKEFAPSKMYSAISISTIRHNAPEIDSLLDKMNLTDVDNYDFAIGSTEFINRFNSFFNVKIILHRPRSLAVFLTPDSTTNENYATHTNGNLGESSDLWDHNFVINLECLDQEKLYIDTKSAIHLIGHYIEQRNAQLQKVPGGFDHLRSTSIIPAARLLSRINCNEDWDKDNLVDANIFTSWINGCISSHILGIDPRLAVIGMIMDSGLNERMDYSLEEFVVQDNLKYLLDRSEVTKIFNNAGGVDFKSVPQLPENDLHLCQQIDNTTNSIINILLSDWLDS